MPTPQDNQRLEAARAAFDNAGREISQAFGVLNSNLTLASGTLAALLAVLGAGELFSTGETTIFVAGERVRTVEGNPETIAGIPAFSNVSLLLLAAAFPLLDRFFIRATIGYQQLQRFNLVQRKTWAYLAGMAPWEEARATVDVYVQRWRSPEPVAKLFWGSFKYGFAWVFAVSIVTIGWAFYSAPDWEPKVVAGVFLLAGFVWEGVTLWRYEHFARPSEEESKELTDAAARPAPRRAEGTGALIEEQRGLFVGLRRLSRGGG